tara:strand:+ start:5172 stop:5786 length:615 start_codon:yes stop_codon:yes gene_type:complete
MPGPAAALPAIVGAGGAGVATGAVATGAAAGAAKTGLAAKIGAGVTRAGKVGVKAAKKDPLFAASIGQGVVSHGQAKRAQQKQASQQQTMEAAQRGREISTGTATAKSEYFGDWVLDEPMLKAWNILKARMEVGPHDEQQDELFEHLKNLNPRHSIQTNEEDNSFILDNIHDQDEDIARRLIESYDRNFADPEPIVPQPESDYF